MSEQQSPPLEEVRVSSPDSALAATAALPTGCCRFFLDGVEHCCNDVTQAWCDQVRGKWIEGGVCPSNLTCPP
jgi:hypothetical protein